MDTMVSSYSFRHEGMQHVSKIRHSNGHHKQIEAFLRDSYIDAGGCKGFQSRSVFGKMYD